MIPKFFLQNFHLIINAVLIKKGAGTKPAPLTLTTVNIIFFFLDYLTTILKVLGSFRGQISIFLLSSKIIIPEKGYFSGIFWLRRLDLNQRPSGYEPDELPSCSTPRYFILSVPFDLIIIPRIHSKVKRNYNLFLF